MKTPIPRLLRVHVPPYVTSAAYHRWKRGLDLVLVLLTSPLTVPLLIVCGLAVRLSSPGPVFFLQFRTGMDGRRFQMIKFRSMVRNASSLKHILKTQFAPHGPDFKLHNDPRVTRVGAFLRKTSLDELPQLWNVVRGDMTLVGPRPTSFGTEHYSLWHTERLDVKPGMTGLWQVERRGDLDFDQRVRLDISYLRRRSLRLDLWILLRTLPAVVLRRGAY